MKQLEEFCLPLIAAGLIVFCGWSISTWRSTHRRIKRDMHNYFNRRDSDENN